MSDHQFYGGSIGLGTGIAIGKYISQASAVSASAATSGAAITGGGTATAATGSVAATGSATTGAYTIFAAQVASLISCIGLGIFGATYLHIRNCEYCKQQIAKNSNV